MSGEPIEGGRIEQHETADVRRDSVTVNGVRLYYLMAGSGDPVVLLHGWPQTSYAWRHIIPILSRQYSVVAPDMRGFGFSEKPEYGYEKKNVARDVHELVRSLGYDRVHLVGHDMGGQVAYPYAAQWPDDVRSLTYIESSLPGFGQERLMDVSNGGSWHFGFNMAGDIAEALLAGRERIFVEHWLRRSAVGAVDPTSITDDALDHYANALAQPGGLRSSLAYYRARYRRIASTTRRSAKRSWACRCSPSPAIAVSLVERRRRWISSPKTSRR